jgi:hypothetical protein
MVKTLKLIRSDFFGIPPNHFPVLQTVILAASLGHMHHPTIERIEICQYLDVDFALQWFIPGWWKCREDDEDSTTPEPPAPNLPALRRLKLVQCRWSSSELAGELLFYRESLHFESDGFGVCSCTLSLMWLKEPYGDRMGILDMEEG